MTVTTSTDPGFVPSKRIWTSRELQQELDQARHEIRLIDGFMAADPKPSAEDQALYAERMVFLKGALADIPPAITWAKRQEKQSKNGFRSLSIKGQL